MISWFRGHTNLIIMGPSTTEVCSWIVHSIQLWLIRVTSITCKTPTLVVRCLKCRQAACSFDDIAAPDLTWGGAGNLHSCHTHTHCGGFTTTPYGWNFFHLTEQEASSAANRQAEPHPIRHPTHTCTDNTAPHRRAQLPRHMQAGSYKHAGDTWNIHHSWHAVTHTHTYTHSK